MLPLEQRQALSSLLSDRPLALLEAAARQLIAGTYAARRDQPRRSAPGVAYVSMVGILAPRQGILAELGWAIDPRDVARAVDKLLFDDQVRAIIIDVDSPGGLTDGVPEAAAMLREARTDARRLEKPIVAVANTMMASAAYWLASQVEVVASPSALVGSIGVYTVHDDLSAAYKKAGVNRTYISAGKYKTEGKDTEPLDAHGKRTLQGIVDYTFDQFIDDVALGRRTTPGAVRKGYGEGLILTAGDAVKLKLADRISALDRVAYDLAVGSPRAQRAQFKVERQRYARIWRSRYLANEAR